MSVATATATAAGARTFRHATLANGLQVVGEVNPYALSVATGFFVKTGARDETAAENGVSHFLEHMAFKGNARTAEQINRGFEDLGAKNNAYTSEEHTVYHAAVLPEYLPQTIDLLAELWRPKLRAEDFAMEKEVILEEIGQYADLPLWTAYELGMRRHFAGHPLGQSILGTAESVGALTAAAMHGYHRHRYTAGNTILAAAGRFDFDALVGLAERHCGDWPAAAGGRGGGRGGGSADRRADAGVLDAGVLVHAEQFVQENLFLMLAAPAAEDDGRMAAEVLATVVGDDTGSRFYWDLIETSRVEHIDFGYSEYQGAGAYMSSIACEADDAAEGPRRGPPHPARGHRGRHHRRGTAAGPHQAGHAHRAGKRTAALAAVHRRLQLVLPRRVPHPRRRPGRAGRGHARRRRRPAAPLAAHRPHGRPPSARWRSWTAWNLRDGCGSPRCDFRCRGTAWSAPFSPPGEGGGRPDEGSCPPVGRKEPSLQPSSERRGNRKAQADPPPGEGGRRPDEGSCPAAGREEPSLQPSPTGRGDGAGPPLPEGEGDGTALSRRNRAGGSRSLRNPLGSASEGFADRGRLAPSGGRRPERVTRRRRAGTPAGRLRRRRRSGRRRGRRRRRGWRTPSRPTGCGPAA